MGKKKKPAKKRDARGYQQGAVAPNPHPHHGTTTSSQAPRPKKEGGGGVTLSSDAPSVTQAVTANFHQNLEDLLALLRIDDDPRRQPPVPLKGPPDARLYSRFGNLLDRLTAFGFSFDQIQRAVKAVGVVMTEESALDWLCLHLPTAELPALFTEGQVRQEETAAATSRDLTVIAAATSKADQAKKAQESAFLEPTILEPNADAASSEEKSSDADDEAKAAQKAWLLSQYEYDDEEGEEYVMGDVSKGEDGDTLDLPDEQQTAEVIEVPQASPLEKEEQPPSPDDIRLQQMQKEFHELEADANNDASNYMRSKQEIKEMQKQVKIMRKQIAGLEHKIERQKAAERAKQEEEAREELLEGETAVALFGDEAEEQDGEETGDIFSLFDNNAEIEERDTTPKADDTMKEEAGVYIPEGSIPANWTGKTPKVILEEWCRKEKVPKPTFQKLPLNGCRLKVRLGNKKTSTSVEIEETGPVSDYKDTQHFCSVKGLYQINPNLPLYRLFPPFYRDLWLSWLDSVRKAKEDQDAATTDQRRLKIEELVQCIPTTTDTRVSGTQTENGGREASVKVESHTISSESWTNDYDGTRPAERSSKMNTASSLGAKLKEKFFRRQETSEYQTMLEERRRLPIYGYRQEILETIRKNPVTILCAETGSGKTTQCSSYVLEQALRDGYGDQTSILCTQPRRVAAISVAERVADELAESSIGKLVGYQIRLEAQRSAETRLLFCTTGVVLRRLIEDPTLKGISHVVVDEVHERQWQIDVLLVSLRSLLSGARPDLKVILMSATLDANLFCSFFNGAPLVNVPGRTYPVSNYYLEDLLEQTNHIIEEGSRYARRDFSGRETVSMWVTTRGGEKRRETADYEMNEAVSDNYPGYMLATRKSMDRVDETVVNYDLIEDVLNLLVQEAASPFTPPEGCGPPTGAVLIFLHGIGEIRTLMDRLSGSRVFGNSRFEIVPMHSTLSSAEQRRAFRPSPAGCRKIIIATNIAETSVTIPDVVYVIDCGRVREIQRDKRTATRKLVSTWCSRASAKQRAGRAGRVQPGSCMKLYSSRTEREVMKSTTEPELRRIPLEEVCLTILAGGFAVSCRDFLAQTPQPPSDDAVRSAVKVLEDIGAVVTSERGNSAELLTGLGQHLAKLPVDARVGKMLIFGAIFKCTDAILTLAACLAASKSPFVSPLNDGQQAKAAHATFSHQYSDFFTLLNMWEAFRQASLSGKARKFCRAMFLNYSALCEIQDARLHYLNLLCGLGFLDRKYFRGRNVRQGTFDERMLAESLYCVNSRKEEVVHSVVCAGLYPNVAQVTRSTVGGEVTVTQKTERLYIHSSVNSKLPARVPSCWITFFEKFGTERRVSVSSTAFVSPFCLMLFGSKLQVLHAERRVRVDDWIELSVAAKTSVIFKEIRDRLDGLLVEEIQDSHSSGSGLVLDGKLSEVVDSVVNLLSQS